ncbi:MAG: glutamate--tRNA ligase [Nanoarchaeota archaeon]|nr:glutamate--tRNA ligase [Nanoarchaeota archaeon]
MEISKEVIRAYALENAIKHNGKANSGAVLSGLFAEGLEKDKIKDFMPKIQDVIKEVNSFSIKKQKLELEKSPKTSKRKIREGLPELQNAEKGKVIMRMAPFPSGPLHIGNARTLILNDEYVKIYDGKLFLVIDDTIGSEEKPIEPEAYKLIVEGINFLNVNYNREIIYKSDRFKKYYVYAEEMLKKGYLYVCDCTQEKMHDLRIRGVECSCRQLPPDVQFEKWKKMFKAPEGSMSVRIKTSMQDPDPAFRDRVMFKISDRPHPRTKKKYRIYPSMEFSWAIDDSLLGTTHVLRGTEHQMSTRIQDFIRAIFGWKNPESIYNGHLGIEGAKFSKSKSAKEVRSGEYIGWNDPRTWSLQSLRDRGIKQEAIRQFIISAGISRTNIKIPIEVLYSLNKKFIEDSSRYFFIENPREIKIDGCPKLTAKIPLHPSLDKGFRKYETSQNFLISGKDYDLMREGKYRLMHLLNFKISASSPLNPTKLSFISEEPINDKNLKFLQWLPADADNIKTKILMTDGSFMEGMSEPETRKLKVGNVIQFERFGFVRLHKKSKEELEFRFAHY